MMSIVDFHGMYIAELQELVSATEQSIGTLARVAGVTSHPALTAALSQQREQAGRQKQRLVSIVEKHGADPTEHSDQSMEALVAETGKMIDILQGDDLRDAGIIASVQKIVHYQIAAYGTAAALAGQLDLRDDQRLLHQCLEDQRLADRLLTRLAKGEVNPDALAA